MLEHIANESNLLESVVTRDETWIFTYDAESKCQLMQWKSPQSPRPKKERMSESKFKVMLIVFINTNRIVIIEIREKRPQLWSDGWFLHQDIPPAHIDLSVEQFLTSKNITVMGYPY
ncbi:HTH_48 domain-containing protein [Trichonephila clavipes]|nr:HTH_48 domain-containing protein [Trichonephila clavipes]